MDSDRIQHEEVERAVKCPACGYDLRAQLHDAGATCSECGRTFAMRDLNPAERYTEDERGERLALMLMPAIVLGVSTFLGLCLALVLDPPPWLVITLIVGAAAGSIIVIARQLTADEAAHRFVRRPVVRFVRNTINTRLITIIVIAVPLITCLCMGVVEGY